MLQKSHPSIQDPDEDMNPSRRVPTETAPQAPAVATDDDFENCKGQCGYTIWCRACMEETKKLIHEAEQKKLAEREALSDGLER